MKTINNVVIENKENLYTFIHNMMSIGINSNDSIFFFINFYNRNSQKGKMNISLTRFIKLQSGNVDSFFEDRKDNINFLRSNNVDFEMRQPSLIAYKTFIMYLYKYENKSIFNDNVNFHLSFIKHNPELFYKNGQKSDLVDFISNIDFEVNKTKELKEKYYNETRGGLYVWRFL